MRFGVSDHGQWGQNSNSTNSVFEVLDGSVFRGAATTRLEVGGGGSSSFNGIVVSNATVNCGAIYLGLLASGTYSYYSSNDYLRVSGPATRIAVSGTATIEDGGTRLVYNGLSGSTAVIVR